MRDKKLVAILWLIYECLEDVAREDADIAAAIYGKMQSLKDELDGTGM